MPLVIRRMAQWAARCASCSSVPYHSTTQKGRSTLSASLHASSLYTSNDLPSFPFVTPNEMEKHLKNMGVLKRYKTLPPPTTPMPHGQSVNTLKGVQRVLGDMRNFKTIYGESIEYLTDGHGFFLAFDEPFKHDAARRLFVKALRMNGRIGGWVSMYERMANELMEDRKWVVPGVGQSRTVYVDIVRDVLNVVPVHWVSEEIVSAWISCVLVDTKQTDAFRFQAGFPLKSKQNPHGIHTEQEIYQFMAVIFACVSGSSIGYSG